MKILKSKVELLYNLERSHIKCIKIRNDKVTLYFKEERGFIDCHNKRVNGYIEFSKVDLDDSYIMTYEYNRKHCFKGKIRSLDNFFSKHKKVDLEIIIDTYNATHACFEGYMFKKDKVVDFKIMLYYLGEMRYLVED